MFYGEILGPFIVLIDAYDSSGKTLDDICGDIKLIDVHFTYPTRPDEPIFTSFSLSIPSGTTIALVGQSRSGKSTVISLMFDQVPILRYQ